ncbi:MAG: hypothetical protein GKR89_19970 [Candidatus Latescibacteria bacterium]|nr:hypothetical protein [Candidatus Latescibacterota bacterium]
MKLTPTEIAQGQLNAVHLAAAVERLHTDGYVVLENAVPKDLVEETRQKLNTVLQAHVDANSQINDPANPGRGIFGLHPPREMPYLDPRFIANSFAVPLLQKALGDDFFCAFYNTNTSWPGSGIQSVHRDSPPLVADHPHPLPPYSIVLNVPLVDFTVETGATQVWPGTHLDNRPNPEGVNTLDTWAADKPSTPTLVPVGSLVLRDMRMWHRGMPNQTQTIRTMLAVVYNRLFYHFDRKLTIPSNVWEQMNGPSQEIFRFNSVVD